MVRASSPECVRIGKRKFERPAQYKQNPYYKSWSLYSTGDGGALERLLPVFKLGGGGSIGNGKQVMSWIHVEDLVNIYLEAMENQSYKGIVNAVSPNYVTNSEFTKYLGAAVKRPALFPVPLKRCLFFGDVINYFRLNSRSKSTSRPRT